LAKKEEKGISITILGVRYPDKFDRQKKINETVKNMVKEIRKNAVRVRSSPAPPVVYIIEPLSAYYYG